MIQSFEKVSSQLRRLFVRELLGEKKCKRNHYRNVKTSKSVISGRKLTFFLNRKNISSKTIKDKDSNHKSSFQNNFD